MFAKILGLLLVVHRSHMGVTKTALGKSIVTIWTSESTYVIVNGGSVFKHIRPSLIVFERERER